MYFENRDNKFPNRLSVGCERKLGFKDNSTYVGISAEKMVGEGLYLEQIWGEIIESSF